MSDKLAKTIWDASRADEGTISATGADKVAAAIRESMLIPVAPLGIPLDRDAIREVWEEFVVRGQGDSLQSIEDRILMAALRSMYNLLPATKREPADA